MSSRGRSEGRPWPCCKRPRRASLAVIAAVAHHASGAAAAASRAPPCRILHAQCYSDALDARTLPVGITVAPIDPHHDDMTAEVCASMCAARGLPFCGVELGVQCFAGKAVNSGSHPKPMADCSTPCSGNRSASCGGSWRMLVFEYSGHCQLPPPPPPPPPQPWQDAALPFEARAADMVARLNESQLVALTAGPGTSAISLNGVEIPATNLGSECLAGFSPPPGYHTTAFPHTVNLGNMFDPALVRRVGSAIGDEARAALNAGLRGEMPPSEGARPDCLSPVLNLARDPRWGRSYESFGEDPTAVGINGAAYLRGLQNGVEEPALEQRGGSKYIKIAAIAKHLGAYSLECYNTDGSDHSRGCEVSRQSFNAIVDPIDLQESYMRPWRLAGRAGLTGAMCSYNAINGVPACADDSMLTAMLKDELGVKGYVIGDDDAVEKIYDMADGGHFYAKNVTQAGADALNAGVDVDYGHVFAPHMATAIAEGMTTVGKLRGAAARAVYPRFATGCFDNPLNATRFSSIPLSVLNGAANIALAKEAALGSIVLLKHQGGHLPIKSGTKVGVFGAAATDTTKQVNRYTGSPAHVVSILEGVQNRSDKSSAAGLVGDFTALSSTQATEAAKGLGVAVVVVETGNSGTRPMSTWKEGEGSDREKIGIPPENLALLEAVAASGTPIVCVAVSGGAMALGPAVDNPSVVAVIGAFTSGEQGGAALADLIYGDEDFSGRLAATMYHANFTQMSNFTDMSMRAYPGRGHRYLQDDSLQLFGFGFGLALTPWSYSTPTLAGGGGGPATISAEALAAGSTLNFSTTVKNPATTERKTSVIALLRRTDAPPAAEGWPKQWLLDFVKPSVAAAASATITFAIDEASVSRWDETNQSFEIRPGSYTAWVVDGVGEVAFEVTA
jgi:beta-glucosidase-like glycosyl hydrolase